MICVSKMHGSVMNWPYIFAIIIFPDDVYEVRYRGHHYEPISCLAHKQCFKYYLNEYGNNFSCQAFINSKPGDPIYAHTCTLHIIKRQGPYTFSKIKFQDISRTIPACFQIFQDMFFLKECGPKEKHMTLLFYHLKSASLQGCFHILEKNRIFWPYFLFSPCFLQRCI